MRRSIARRAASSHNFWTFDQRGHLDCHAVRSELANPETNRTAQPRSSVASDGQPFRRKESIGPSRETRAPPTSSGMTHVSETHTYVDLKFFSSVSEMTLRFDDKLDMLAARIPLQRQEPALVTHRQFVLITPTYGGGNGRGAVPK